MFSHHKKRLSVFDILTIPYKRPLFLNFSTGPLWNTSTAFYSFSQIYGQAIDLVQPYTITVLRATYCYKNLLQTLGALLQFQDLDSYKTGYEAPLIYISILEKTRGLCHSFHQIPAHSPEHSESRNQYLKSPKSSKDPPTS